MLTLISEHRCFGGVQRFYRHDAPSIGLPMRFGVFLPPESTAASAKKKTPALIYLAGLTCNEETFAFKGGAQKHAAALGIALVTPDTSPRGANISGEGDAWDFGVAASFYLDATQSPWVKHYRMERYLTDDLPSLLESHLPIDVTRLGVFGHSMGGHGALTVAQRHPDLFKSVSAFAPICAPSQCPWGEKAFAGYLGSNHTTWREHDATALMQSQHRAPFPDGILIDQGLADKFLNEQLHPNAFAAACETVGQRLTLRWHEGYDHGYYFISTFINDHLDHHARSLLKK